MPKPKITAHCLVCNEERWVWYAIMSIINYVDEILVWDTGSTDKTVEIIKTINSSKIKFREVGPVDPVTFTLTRNEMLKITKTPWLLVLDGDEIWTNDACTELINNTDKKGYEFSVRSNYNLIGDVYHYQEPLGGRYKIGPFSGHINIRGVNIQAISGIHFDGTHGQQGVYDASGTLIQNRLPFRAKLAVHKYFHATHLTRSHDLNFDRLVPKRKIKYKYELGIEFADDFSYPEVFYLPRPSIVPSPWDKRTFFYTVNALWQTPLKMIKRRFISPKTGY